MNYPDSSTVNTTAKKIRFSFATRALIVGLALLLPGVAALAERGAPPLTGNNAGSIISPAQFTTSLIRISNHDRDNGDDVGSIISPAQFTTSLQARERELASIEQLFTRIEATKLPAEKEKLSDELSQPLDAYAKGMMESINTALKQAELAAKTQGKEGSTGLVKPFEDLAVKHEQRMKKLDERAQKISSLANSSSFQSQFKKARASTASIAFNGQVGVVPDMPQLGGGSGVIVALATNKPVVGLSGDGRRRGDVATVKPVDVVPNAVGGGVIVAILAAAKPVLGDVDGDGRARGAVPIVKPVDVVPNAVNAVIGGIIIAAETNAASPGKTAGTPIQDTSVRLEGDPGSIEVSANTNSMGDFKFDKLPAGKYKLTLTDLPPQSITVGADGIAAGKMTRGNDGSINIFDRWGNLLVAAGGNTDNIPAGNKVATNPGFEPPKSGFAGMGGGGPGILPGMGPGGPGPGPVGPSPGVMRPGPTGPGPAGPGHGSMRQ